LAQLNNKFQIIRATGMTAGDWLALTCPTPSARRIRIRNTDGAAAMTVCTDDADANSIITLAAGGELEIELVNDRQGTLSAGDPFINVKGAGAQPLLLIEG
jgi:hypothetical protein